jgi:hypothetical protein
LGVTFLVSFFGVKNENRKWQAIVNRTFGVFNLSWVVGLDESQRMADAMEMVARPDKQPIWATWARQIPCCFWCYLVGLESVCRVYKFV